MTLREFMRAFRALGLPKRDGGKMTVDEAMFKSFDTVRCRVGSRECDTYCGARSLPSRPLSHVWS